MTPPSHPILKSIAKGEIRDVCLDLGCGTSKKEGFIGVDLIAHEGVDIVADVFEVLASLPDHVVRAVHSSQFFEHIYDIQRLLSEIDRVMQSGGTLIVRVPHFSNPYYYSDPTHVRHFGLYTFSYLSRSSLFKRKVPRYAENQNLLLESVSLIFDSPVRKSFRSLYKHILSLIFSSYFMMELYEECFCYLFPCSDIVYSLKKY